MRSQLTKFREVLRGLLPKLHEILLYGGTILLVTDEFLRSTFHLSFLATPDVRIAIGIGLLALFVFGINRRLNTIKTLITNLLNHYAAVIEILPAHHTVDFADIVERCGEVRLLTLSGTQLGMLGDSRVLSAICNPHRRSRLTILLADPFAEAIRTRYATDEPDTWEAGPDGIARRLAMLHKQWLALTARCRNSLTIRVYSSYPTIGMIQGDHDFYSSTYGFKIRGNDCPKVHSKIGDYYATFLLKHFQSVYDNSIPLGEWINKHPQTGAEPQ